jgi:hypothetical protein
MEYILIHKPIGLLPPEAMKLTMEKAKQLSANVQAFVPGGNLIASYYAVAVQEIFCVWDLPNFESIAPVLRQMMAAGWNTEVIPVEKSAVALANMEKMMQTMQAPAMAR